MRSILKSGRDEREISPHPLSSRTRITISASQTPKPNTQSYTLNYVTKPTLELLKSPQHIPQTDINHNLRCSLLHHKQNPHPCISALQDKQRSFGTAEVDRQNSELLMEAHVLECIRIPYAPLCTVEKKSLAMNGRPVTGLMEIHFFRSNDSQSCL